MDFCRTVIHVVQPGDTFYRLAQRYQTTVPDLIMRNPGVNPYNLQVGTRLRICSGLGDSPRQEELELNNDMREAWTQHGFWETLDLISRYYALPNEEAVSGRLQKTPEEIAAVFGRFYSPATVEQLTSLLNEHVRLTGELMKSLRDGETEQAEQTEKAWRENAGQIARLWSSAGMDYSYEELDRMLQTHLDLMKRQMMTDLKNQYDEFVSATDENTAQLLQLADALTKGLVRQFFQA